MIRTLTVESPTGTRHDYTVTLGVARTGCGRVVPQARGWFGPIDHDTDCARCVRVRDRRKGEAVSDECGRCAWCLKDHTPRRRGYELTCPHGLGCCRNCQTCNPESETR